MENVKLFKAREFQLQKAWNRIVKNTTFVSKDKKSIKIISRGVWNVEEGPDFRSAIVEIDGREVVGDVELHVRASDWDRHGHSGNPLYSNVILHVVAEDDEGDRLSRGTPVIVLAPQKSKKKPSKIQEFPNGKCVGYFSGFADEELVGLLLSAGLERFEIKTEQFLAEMLAEGGDSVILKNIFAAFGYKKNSENFIELFRRYRQHEPRNAVECAAVLWGESGLMPDTVSASVPEELRDFFAKIWSVWWRTRREDRPPIPWNYSGVRPVNMPERRIAALAILLGRLGATPASNLFLKALEAGSGRIFLEYLEDVLFCSDPLWNRYLIKGGLGGGFAVLGKERAREVIVNIILPSLAAFSTIMRKPLIKEKCGEAFLFCGRTQPNSVIRLASHRWFMPPSRVSRIVKSAATAQGVIHLFRNYCEKCVFDCERCMIKSFSNKQSL